MTQPPQVTGTTATVPPSPPPSGVHVRCAGCRMILTVGAGFREFACPSCHLPQMLPPELLNAGEPSPQTLPLPHPPHQHQQHQQQPFHLKPAHGIDPTKIQLPCANCKAILNVPHGLARFRCPQCMADLAVDISKLNDLLPPPDEVNEVAIDVEREEDEGGMLGETFTDYRPSKLSIGPPHSDPVVETSCLSVVQPPDPTYDLKIADILESSPTLSCLQIEILIYACQRHLQHLSDGTRGRVFIGDGAGMGKGRTIAGLVWENWHQGRGKALWISVGSDLKYDARRDLDDVGETCVEGLSIGIFNGQVLVRM
ncbi:hypothetical protein MLD38_002323 [Melastoma candidum]|uniref:Uncharacterized protein n=1 Tax=Melastoma candidum TaxID=119954 RepID=A0ACB9SJD4_9MYRT|nr:hypothetical protein MLD38_002323 [Melastoma candidum]